jgi:cellobiose phosphorylase
MQQNYHTIDKARPVDIPYSVIGNGQFFTGFGTVGTTWRPGDMELYVMLAAAEYVMATKDTAFLQEKVWFYDANSSERGRRELAGWKRSSSAHTQDQHQHRQDRHSEHTVLQALQRMLDFSIDIVGVGNHGLMRMMTRYG